MYPEVRCIVGEIGCAVEFRYIFVVPTINTLLIIDMRDGYWMYGVYG